MKDAIATLGALGPKQAGETLVPEEVREAATMANAWQPRDPTPKGFRRVDSASVYVNEAGDVVVVADPSRVWDDYEDHDGDHPHNCDAMGCGWEHVILRGALER